MEDRVFEESQLQVGRTESGFVIRVIGRGTCRESAAAREFAVQAYRSENCTVAIDLYDCDYLDSTFLGCLVNLCKEYGVGHRSRFVVMAPPEKSAKLLGASRLDQFLEITAETLDYSGTLVQLPCGVDDPSELGRHVMQCHRELADLDGPHAAAFARIAEQLERELAEKVPGPLTRKGT